LAANLTILRVRTT